MNNDKTLYGFYSAKAAKWYGTSIWMTASGEPVEITSASDTENGEDYLWDDKVSVGIVTTWLGDGKPAKASFER
jgi:hypothetical protein